MAENARAWRLLSLDDGTLVEGQFEGRITEDVRSSYASLSSVNRKTPILQFIKGETNATRIDCRVFAKHASDGQPLREIRQLKEWAQRGADVPGRPAVLSFLVGDGHIRYDSAVLESVSNIVYDPITSTGALRGASFTLTILEYVPFSLSGGKPTESRYHRAGRRDYYEMLAQREYGDPELGEALRRRNPDKLDLIPGDVVKLPSVRALAGFALEPASDQLRDSFSRKETPQKANLRRILDARAGEKVTRVSLQGA